MNYKTQVIEDLERACTRFDNINKKIRRNLWKMQSLAF